MPCAARHPGCGRMTTPAWRWIDTGVRRPAENLALNRALLEARQAREIPSTKAAITPEKEAGSTTHIAVWKRVAPMA